MSVYFLYRLFEYRINHLDDDVADNIVSVLISHLSDNENLTIGLLSRECHMSLSTVSRFVKKIGYDSFKEFSLKYSSSRMEYLNFIENYLDGNNIVGAKNLLTDNHVYREATYSIASSKKMIIIGEPKPGNLYLLDFLMNQHGIQTQYKANIKSDDVVLIFVIEENKHALLSRFEEIRTNKKIIITNSGYSFPKTEDTLLLEMKNSSFDRTLSFINETTQHLYLTLVYYFQNMKVIS